MQLQDLMEKSGKPSSPMMQGSLAAEPCPDIAAFRSRFNQHAKEVNAQHSMLNATGAFSLQILLIITAAILATVIFNHWKWIGLAFDLPLMLFIGTRLHCLRNITHECAHYSFTSDRKGNDIFGHIQCVMDFDSFSKYRKDHITHHRYTGDPQRDADFFGKADFHFEEPASGRMLLRHFLAPFRFRYFLTTPKPAPSEEALKSDPEPKPIEQTFSLILPTFADEENPVWVKPLRVVYPLALLAVAALSGWWPVLLFYVIPYFFYYKSRMYWTDAIDHGGILLKEQEFDRTRNFLLPWNGLTWLFFPRNDNYHLVHHLYPYLSTWNQPKLHHIMEKNDPYYRALPHLVTEKWRAMKARNAGKRFAAEN